MSFSSLIFGAWVSLNFLDLFILVLAFQKVWDHYFLKNFFHHLYWLCIMECQIRPNSLWLYSGSPRLQSSQATAGQEWLQLSHVSLNKMLLSWGIGLRLHILGGCWLGATFSSSSCSNAPHGPWLHQSSESQSESKVIRSRSH